MISIAKAVLCLICVSDSFVLYFMPITMYIYIPKLISKLFLKIVQHYILAQNLLQLAGCFRSIQWIQDYAHSACKPQALCRLPSICPHLQTGGCPQLEKNWWQNVVEQNTSIVGVGYIITYILGIPLNWCSFSVPAIQRMCIIAYVRWFCFRMETLDSVIFWGNNLAGAQASHWSK